MIKAWVATKRVFEDNSWQMEFGIANRGFPNLSITDVSEQAVGIVSAIPVFMCEVTVHDDGLTFNEETSQMEYLNPATPADLAELDYGIHSLLLGWEEVREGINTGQGNANDPVAQADIDGANAWLGQFIPGIDVSVLVQEGMERLTAKNLLIQYFKEPENGLL